MRTLFVREGVCACSASGGCSAKGSPEPRAVHSPCLGCRPYTPSTYSEHPLFLKQLANTCGAAPREFPPIPRDVVGMHWAETKRCLPPPGVGAQMPKVEPSLLLSDLEGHMSGPAFLQLGSARTERGREGPPHERDSAACDALVGYLRSPTTLPEFLPYQPCIAVPRTTVAMTGNAE